MDYFGRKKMSLNGTRSLAKQSTYSCTSPRILTNLESLMKGSKQILIKIKIRVPQKKKLNAPTINQL